jgi:hypothetical protein
MPLAYDKARWDAIMADGRAKREASTVAQEEHETQIIEPGQWIERYQLPAAGKSAYDLLDAAGYKTVAGLSVTFTPGHEYGPSAQKAGEMSPDVTAYNYWVEAGKPGERVWLNFVGKKRGLGAFKDGYGVRLTKYTALIKVGEYQQWIKGE